MNKLTVVLMSGGLDSAVAAAVTGQNSRLALLHLQYGQQAAEREASAFHAMVDWLKPVHSRVASLGEWGQLTDSALVTPKRDIEDAAAVGAYLASTFTPMLAPAMLCAAAAWGYTFGAQRIIWGVSLDNPGNYPDRADAVRLLAWQLIHRSLPEGRSPTVEAPLAQYNKEAVVQLAQELDVPIAQTWSCLRGFDAPCKRCIGCVTREKALARAGAVKTR